MPLLSKTQERHCLFLSIISIFPMLAEIVLILKLLWRRFRLRIDHLTPGCHFRHFLQHHRIVNCLSRIFPPGKGAVILA